MNTEVDLSMVLKSDYTTKAGIRKSLAQEGKGLKYIVELRKQYYKELKDHPERGKLQEFVIDRRYLLTREGECLRIIGNIPSIAQVDEIEYVDDFQKKVGKLDKKGNLILFSFRTEKIM